MAGESQQTYPYAELHQVLGERPPLLMVDRVGFTADASAAQGLKTVSFNEPYFQGHFPASPIMPGVLQVGAMSQLCSALHRRRQQPDSTENALLLRSIRQLKFRQPVYPGAALQVHAEPVADEPHTYKAWTEVDGVVTCQGTLSLAERGPDSAQRRDTPLDQPLVLDGVQEDSESLDVTAIMEAIPHRFPFLLVDRVLHLDRENLRIVGLKNVTGNEPIFAGTSMHVLPEHLQCEIAAQTGCTLALTREGYGEKLAYFMSIARADFFEPVVPGDRLVIDLSVSAKGRFGRAEGYLAVGSRRVSEIEMKFAIVDRQ